jgi:hypothetical protein
MKMSDNGFARRNRLDLNSPVELSIRAAMHAVEQIGAEPLLTEALNLLIRAREMVSDYVERCDTCDGKRRVKSRHPASDIAYEVPCPTCTVSPADRGSP